MTWANRGKWHIHPIVPSAFFDLTDVISTGLKVLILEAFILLSPSATQQYECFNYKKLQPLWASDTMANGARLDWLPPAGSAYPDYKNAGQWYLTINCLLIKDLQLFLSSLLDAFSRELLLQMGLE